MKIQFWFVRHGETLFNQKGREQGICDSPLTENGIEQTKQAAQALATQAFDHIFVSPLGRALQTKEILIQDASIPTTIMEDLHEMNYGKFQGSRFTSHADEIRSCFKKCDFSTVGGESKMDIERRIDRVFADIRNQCQDGDRVLVIGHGGFERVLLTHLLGVNLEEYDETRLSQRRGLIPNAGIMTFDYDESRYVLKSLPIEPEKYQPRKDSKTVHFYFVRHGECLFNVYSRMQGLSDSPLTETGKEQATITADALSKIHFDAIYASPLGRAKKTAQIIASKHSAPITFNDGLKEVSVGDFEGVVTNDWITEINDRHLYKGWKDVGGESREEVALRIYQTFNKIISKAKDGDTVLLISHGNYYCNVLLNLFKIKRDELFRQARSEGRQAVPNGGIARFDWNQDHYDLVHLMLSPEEFWNEKRTHLYE